MVTQQGRRTQIKYKTHPYPTPLWTKDPFGYSWKLKIETEKHCSKIIFKCVNSIVRPIFNEKVDKKWYLWVHEQCTNALVTVEKVSLYGWKQKNKKRGWNTFCTQTWTQNVQTKHSLRHSLHMQQRILLTAEWRTLKSVKILRISSYLANHIYSWQSAGSGAFKNLMT